MTRRVFFSILIVLGVPYVLIAQSPSEFTVFALGIIFAFSIDDLIDAAIRPIR